MRLLMAVRHTFQNMHWLSVMFLYIGLEFAAGLIAVSVLLTALQGHFGDYVTMICSAKGAQEAGLTCLVLSVFAAMLCDAAAKERGLK